MPTKKRRAYCFYYFLFMQTFQYLFAMHEKYFNKGAIPINAQEY